MTPLVVRDDRLDSRVVAPLVQALFAELLERYGVADADPDHPFYGRVIVFTGTLMSRTRQMAWDDVVRVGGIPELGVTKRTNILVTGDINPAVLAPGTPTTGKAAKAFRLQDKGQDIEVMTEDDFLRSL